MQHSTKTPTARQERGNPPPRALSKVTTAQARKTGTSHALYGFAASISPGSAAREFAAAARVLGLVAEIKRKRPGAPQHSVRRRGSHPDPGRFQSVLRCSMPAAGPQPRRGRRRAAETPAASPRPSARPRTPPSYQRPPINFTPSLPSAFFEFLTSDRAELRLNNVGGERLLVQGHSSLSSNERSQEALMRRLASCLAKLRDAVCENQQERAS